MTKKKLTAGVVPPMLKRPSNAGCVATYELPRSARVIQEAFIQIRRLICLFKKTKMEDQAALSGLAETFYDAARNWRGQR
jgi:hypothetical protein